ncbi:MAG: hypothetical protein SCH39_00850 [Methanosarcinales archaeon]|nr:hypothetical protein [ANME-2 cluster archaeon]MDW7774866.1 hypothetical protein [Methanosarcinales archaeon]
MADKKIDIKEYLGNDDAKTIRNYLRLLEGKLFHVYSLYRIFQLTLIFVIILIVGYLVYINLF